MPSLGGLSPSTAAARLRDAGFIPTIGPYVDSSYPVGTVAYTSPSAGSTVGTGSGVTIYVSDGTPYVAPQPSPRAGGNGGGNGNGNGNNGSSNGGSSGNGLRRRVPGNQLPQDTGPKAPVAPPSTDDALAAREAFEAFEAGVTRAQWDVIEAEIAGTPAPDAAPAGHPPLARRTPGASLPDVQPRNSNPPPASPRRPLDPDAARALVEQFEYGVALALNESKSQHEGQSR
jgi:hypothetical protein